MSNSELTNTDGAYEVIFSTPSQPIFKNYHSAKEPIHFHAGCDMKTLRKQLDVMNSEVEDVTKSQRSLYDKNVMLWQYMQSLIESNSSNSTIMKKNLLLIERSLEDLYNQRNLFEKKLSQLSATQKV